MNRRDFIKTVSITSVGTVCSSAVFVDVNWPPKVGDIALRVGNIFPESLVRITAIDNKLNYYHYVFVGSPKYHGYCILQLLKPFK